MIKINGGKNLSSVISSARRYFGPSTELWFRGQPFYDHELRPRIFRQGEPFGYYFDESGMYDEFTRRFPEQGATHKTVYEWLTLMQHYGLPTRLLDWTTSAVVAIYFCCYQDHERDGAIFAFNPKNLNWNDFFSLNSLMSIQVTSSSIPAFYEALIYNTGDILNDESMINDICIKDIKDDLPTKHKFTHKLLSDNLPFKSLLLWQAIKNGRTNDGEILDHGYLVLTSHLYNIIPFKSPLLNTRIRQQHGCFTFHGGKYFNGKEFIKVDKMEKALMGRSLLKIKIKARDKELLLRELEIAGIREATLFPEMEYQAKEIEKKYKYKLTSIVS